MPFLGTLCLDIDECAATPGICGTNAACRNTPGSFSCSCLSSFMGNPPNVPCREPCQGVTCSDHAFCRCFSSNKSNRHFDFNNFFLIDATDRSKIRSDKKYLFIDISLYPLSFFANTPFKSQKNVYSI